MTDNTLDSNQLKKLTEVFQIVFNTPELVIRDDLTANDVPGWDSFNHVNLVMSIEEEFEVQFSSFEISSMRCVGDLKNLLATKMANNSADSS